MKVKTIYLFFLLYSLIAIGGYILIAIPQQQNEIDIRIEADSWVYKQKAEIIKGGSGFRIETNFFGPALYYRLLGRSNHAVFIANMLVLLWFVALSGRFYDPVPHRYIFFFIVNPMVFFSLFTLNKEIISIISLNFYLLYLNRGRPLIYLLLSMVIAFSIRWQLSVVLIILWLIQHIPLFNKNRKAILLFMIIFLSIAIPFLSPLLSMFETLDQSQFGTGATHVLNNLQNHFLFFIALIPKALLNLIGSTTGIPNTFRGIDDFYNQFIVVFQAFSFLMVFVYLFIKNKLNILNLYSNRFHVSNGLNLFLSVYIILFSVSPFIQNRYFFICYMVLVIVASNEKPLKAAPEK